MSVRTYEEHDEMHINFQALPIKIKIFQVGT